MQSNLNNLLVHHLMRGEKKAIESLRPLINNPFYTLDLVKENEEDLLSRQPSIPDTERQTVLYWIHQAPIADAAEYCWEEWLFPTIESLQSIKQLEYIIAIANETFKSGWVSGQPQPILTSWEKLHCCIGYANEAWSEKTMFNILFSTLEDSLKNQGVDNKVLAIFEGMFNEGYVAGSHARSWIAQGKVQSLSEIPGTSKISDFILDLPERIESKSLLQLAQNFNHRCIQLIEKFSHVSPQEAVKLNQQLSNLLDYQFSIKDRIPGYELDEEFFKATQSIRYNTSIELHNRDRINEFVLEFKVMPSIIKKPSRLSIERF